MQLAGGTAPHWRTQDTVAVIMRQVIFALMPAIIATYWFFGIGILINIAVAGTAALITEFLALKMRGRPVMPCLTDLSAIVTAMLFAMCLPPLTPWWVTATGAIFAIAIAKHMYGGLGYNVFNPAMAGYVAVLISFPDALSHWQAPDIDALNRVTLDSLTTLKFAFTGQLPDGLSIDAISRATPLDSMQTQLGMQLTPSEIIANPLFGDFGTRGWEWIASCIALGGIWLLIRGIIHWHVPTAMLLTLTSLAGIGYLIDSSRFPGPGFHLFSGGAMLCAFFIATDPVSGATSNKGRLIFGAGIGALTYLIRTWGSYADGIAFSILLMNMAAPLIDRYTRPRIYGQSDHHKNPTP
jgi:Na+-translocating ferredoxin:NAD+ oxidoreductase subunit D